MRRLVPIVLACLAATACGWSAADGTQAERCLEALRYRLADDPVKVIDVDFDHRSRSVSLGFESDARPLRRIVCRHEPGDRWMLESVVIGDEPLSEAAVALVNSELLLRDLADERRRSEHPRSLRDLLSPWRPAHPGAESG